MFALINYILRVQRDCKMPRNLGLTGIDRGLQSRGIHHTIHHLKFSSGLTTVAVHDTRRSKRSNRDLSSPN